MRTTLTIDDDLMRELREIAGRKELPLKRLVNQAIRAGLRELEQGKPARRYRCPVFSMGGLVAEAFDLDKALALAAALEDEEVARKLALRK